MKKYEYTRIGIFNQTAIVTKHTGEAYKLDKGGAKLIHDAVLLHINELGRQGWKLVSVVNTGQLGQGYHLIREID